MGTKNEYEHPNTRVECRVKSKEVEYSKDVSAEPSSPDDAVVIAIAMDPETWLPQVVLGVPLEQDEYWESWPIDGVAPVTMTPDEAYQVGAYLIQAASTVASYYTELLDRSMEERKEIIELEARFLGVDYLPEPD